MFQFVRRWDFYHPVVINPGDEDDNNLCFENTALVLISNYQYLIVCMVFSISKPFRQPLYSNSWFTLSLLLLFGASTYIALSNDSFITSLVEIETSVTLEFRLATLIIVVINSLITYGFERIVVWYVSIWWKSRNDANILRE